MLTQRQKHRLLAVGIFIVLANLLPASVIYFPWLMFTMTVIFWLLVSVVLSTILLSWWAGRER